METTEFWYRLFAGLAGLNVAVIAYVGKTMLERSRRNTRRIVWLEKRITQLEWKTGCIAPDEGDF